MQNTLNNHKMASKIREIIVNDMQNTLNNHKMACKKRLIIVKCHAKYD